MEATTSSHANHSASEQPQKSSLRHLFAFTVWRHSWLLVAGLVTAILVGALTTTQSILLGRIFAVISQFGSGHLTGAETIAQISSWCVLLAVVGGAAFIINFGFICSWVAFGELQGRNIRSEIFRGLLKKEMEWFDTRPDGIASLLVRTQTYTHIPESRNGTNTTNNSSDRHASCKSHRPSHLVLYSPASPARPRISSWPCILLGS